MTASHPIDIPPPPPATGRGGGAGPPDAVDAAAQRAVADAMWRTACERVLPSQEEVDAACAAEPAAAWGFYLLPAAYTYHGPPAGSWSPPASYDAYDLGVAVRRTSRPTSSSSSSSSASSSPSPSRSPPPHGRKATRRSKRGGRRGGAAVRARR